MHSIPPKSLLASLSLVAALPAVSSAAAPQTLVENINQAVSGTFSSSSNPDFFSTTSSRLFFRATGPNAGTELYATDGSSGAAALFADINPGSDSSFPGEVVELPSGALLLPASISTGFDRTVIAIDGTTGNAAPLLSPTGSTFTGVDQIVLHQGLAYFFADSSGSVDPDLWRSDGTTVGTTLVEGFAGLDLDSDLVALASSSGDLYFAINARFGADWRWGVFRTDGSPGAAVQLADILANGSPSGFDMQALGAGLVFTANSAATGSELWVSDGTAAGTAVADLTPGPGNSSPLQLTLLGGEVFFAAVTGGGREVFKTDGSVAGTVQVTSGQFDTVGELAAVAGNLVFRGFEASSGAEPWITTGAVGAEQLLADLVAGSGSSFPESFVEVGGQIVCSATVDFAVGNELVVLDPNQVLAPQVIDVDPDGSSGPESLTLFQGRVYFNAFGTFVGRELFSTDGTVGGTGLEADLVPTVGDTASNPQGLARIGTQALFTADDGTAIGEKLFVTDTTGAGTATVAEGLGLQFSPSSTTEVFAGFELAGRGFFVAETAATGEELWVSDGTDAGTLLLADIAAGVLDSAPLPLAIWRGELYFSAADPQTGRELYATDGTPAGTRLVRDIDPGPLGSFPSRGVVNGDQLYFSATTSADGRELWSTDGTSAGTVQVIDLLPGSGSGIPVFSAASFGGELYFFGQGAPAQGEVWRTDGTAAGTSLFADLSGAASSGPFHFTAGGDRLFFTAYDPPDRQLYATDGTAVVQLTDSPLVVPDLGFKLIGTADGAIAWMDDGTSGDAIVFSDGTVPGTTTIANLFAVSSTSGDPYAWRLTSGPHVLFAADQPETGSELWVTDGTAPGTQRLTDVNVGPSDSQITQVGRVGGDLLFGAASAGIGLELFSLPIASFGGWVAEPFGVGCAGSSGMAPAIEAGGSGTVGGQLDVAVTGASPGAITGLYFSTDFVAGTLAGCPFYLTAPTLLTTGGADGSGTTAIALPIPGDPALAGAELWLQAASVELGGALFGLAGLTPALEVVVGP